MFQYSQVGHPCLVISKVPALPRCSLCPWCAPSQAGTSPVLAKGTRFWRVALLSEQGQSPLELQLHLECQADNWWASNVPVVFVPAVPKVKGTSVFSLSKHDCTKGNGWIVLLAPQK